MKNEKENLNKPKVMVLSGYGLNCEEETKFAFESQGGACDIIHINDLISSPHFLKKYQILAFPGGFSYGDDTGSGKAFANKFKNHLSKEIREFLARDTLTIGICNGFQILTNLSILKGALTYNKNGKYIDRWVDLKVRGESPWLRGIEKISLPIAHGEGRYVEDKKNKLDADEIALEYFKGDVCEFQNLESNPNGSEKNIAGVLSCQGRVLGLMPHPERAIFFHHSPLWQIKKSRKALTEEGDGIVLFRNAINYFKK